MGHRRALLVERRPPYMDASDGTRCGACPPRVRTIRPAFDPARVEGATRPARLLSSVLRAIECMLLAPATLRRASGCHDLVVADNGARAVNADPIKRILIGANVFDDMALGCADTFQQDPLKEAANRPVLDGDVLLVDRVDAVRLRAEAGEEAAEPEAVEVEHHVVRLDVNGVTRRHGGAQVASEAVHTLHGDDGGQRRDGRAGHGFGAGRGGAQDEREQDEQYGGACDCVDGSFSFEVRVSGTLHGFVLHYTLAVTWVNEKGFPGELGKPGSGGLVCSGVMPWVKDLGLFCLWTVMKPSRCDAACGRGAEHTTSL